MSHLYRHSSSDPIPFVQVGLALRSRASQLADILGVPRQHALGALVEWWELCVDQDPSRHDVVLSAASVKARFRLASGRDVDPDTLVHLGLLERHQGGYRVRGSLFWCAP